MIIYHDGSYLLLFTVTVKVHINIFSDFGISATLQQAPYLKALI